MPSAIILGATLLSFAILMAARIVARAISGLRDEALWWRRRPVLVPRDMGHPPEGREAFAESMIGWARGKDGVAGVHW